MTRAYATPDELRRAGWSALVAELGPTNATRFLLQYERGSEDYTQLRQQLFRDQTVARILPQLSADKDT
jgi:hypothetical protein